MVERDTATAAHWFGLAAEQGDPAGQYHLGILHANGQGVTQDDVRAMMWLRLSAEAGNTAAERDAVRLAEEMSPSQIENAEKLMDAWRRNR